MKTNYLLITLACAAISCYAGPKSEKNGHEAETETQQVAAEEAVATEFFITENGFGPLKVGGKVNAVKANPVAGLYDKVTAAREFNEMDGIEQINGTLSLNGKEIGTFMADTDGTIYCIQLTAPFIKLKINEKVFTIGGNFNELTKQRGVTIDDYGSAIYKGVTCYDVNDKIGSFNLGSPF